MLVAARLVGGEHDPRAELGPLVSPISYRNPHLLADMARTVDHVSGGRVVLGLGAGWFQRDYDRYGYHFGTRASRIRALGRAVPEIIGRLETLNPPPMRRMPILIAGVGLTLTLPIVARYADSWHAFFPDEPAEVEPAVAALLRYCDEIDRDPAEIEWGVGVDPEDLERFLADDAPTYVEMGFTQFTWALAGRRGPWTAAPRGSSGATGSTLSARWTSATAAAALDGLRRRRA